MSTLIVGGLFALGIIALIALVFVVRSEPHAQTPTPNTTAVKSAPSVERRVEEIIAPTTTASPAAPVLPPLREGSIPMRSEEQRFPIANGQFHELSVELHTLHEQAQEIEHRLSILMEMIERIEHSPSGRIGFDEDVPRSTGVSSER